jgi:hypothetical protein
MQATLVKLEKKPSRYGGYFYYAFFKNKDGKSYYTCLYPKMRNFKKWKPLMKEGITLKGLRIKKDRLLDADSPIKQVRMGE